jgi:hypothetical protein
MFSMCRCAITKILATLVIGFVAPSGAMAADIPLPTKALTSAAPVIDSWTFKFTPYVWLVFDTGNLKLGDKTARVNTNIFKIIENVDNIYAWMSYQEIRRGPLALYVDVFWTRMNFSDTKSGVFPISRFIDVSAVANAKIWVDFAIVEPAITYQFANWTSDASSTSLDFVAGARYWYLRPDVNLNLTATVSIPALGLSRTGSGSASAAKTIDWVDPIVGLRVHHVPAPGQELILQGDVGGFGVGSKFTWQALATYNIETHLFGYKVTPYVGYRAISIDYQQGSGNNTIGLDIVQHGPVIGMTFKW